jgi:diaminohydroxyphosphoribosylaminopyrimidine deaminase/5-amino-6-(5-phosphoribosylamino)uracil reductase
MSDFSSSDCAHMAHALRLAARGLNTAQPNPMVGCVLVRDGKVVGEGWHEMAGEPHAEVNAIAAAGDQAEGATAYVTLEPCAHHGKTPPCSAALIKAGVAEVVVALADPNPAVNGEGLKALTEVGIRCRTGLMRAEAEALNSGFIKRMTHGTPFVRLKVAASLDGGTAMLNGESQWITGPEARADVQRLRARSGAIMTGVGTVLADDPSLTVRDSTINTGGKQPLRVVLDTELRTPSAAKMLTEAGNTLVYFSHGGESDALVAAGAEVVKVDAFDEHVDAAAVLLDLAVREVNDVLVEAGPALAGNLLARGLVDELVIYQSPHIMGSETQGMFTTPTWTQLADRKSLHITDVRRVGADTRITANLAG